MDCPFTTYRSEQCGKARIVRFYNDGALVATATSYPELNITTVVYNRGPGERADDELLKSSSFIYAGFRSRLRML